MGRGGDARLAPQPGRGGARPRRSFRKAGELAGEGKGGDLRKPARALGPRGRTPALRPAEESGEARGRAVASPVTPAAPRPGDRIRRILGRETEGAARQLPRGSEGGGSAGCRGWAEGR